MRRNVLCSAIALPGVGLAVVAYLYYQESKSGINIETGEHGIKIEEN